MKRAGGVCMKQFLSLWWQETLLGFVHPWLLLWVWILPGFCIGLVAQQRSLVRLPELTIAESNDDHSPASLALLRVLHNAYSSNQAVRLTLIDEPTRADFSLHIPSGFQAALDGADGVSNLAVSVNGVHDAAQLAALQLLDRVISHFELNQTITRALPQLELKRASTSQVNIEIRRSREFAGVLALWVALIGIMASLPLWLIQRGTASEPMDMRRFKAWLAARLVWLGISYAGALGIVGHFGLAPHWGISRTLLAFLLMAASCLSLSLLSVALASRLRSLQWAQALAVLWLGSGLLHAHPGFLTVGYLNSGSRLADWVQWLPMNLLIRVLGDAAAGNWVVLAYPVLVLGTWLSVAACVGLKLIRVSER